MNIFGVDERNCLLTVWTLYGFQVVGYCGDTVWYCFSKMENDVVQGFVLFVPNVVGCHDGTGVLT